MANPWDEFYRSVGIGGPSIPPNYNTPTDIGALYSGILPAPSSGLTTRSVNTVPIPNPVSYTLSGQAGIGPGGSARGSVSYMPPVMPNQPNGSIVANKVQDRLTPNQFGYGTGYTSGLTPAQTAIAQATQTPGLPGWGASRPSFPSGGSGKDIQLQFEPGDVSGQRFADSEGRTFRTPSGKVYSPSGGAGAAPVLGGSPQDMRGREPARPGGMLGGSLLSFLTPKAVAPRTSAGVPIAAASGVRGPGNAIYASGGRSYGSDPGQVTIGLKPGERTYDPVSNSWGLKTR